MPPSFSPFDRRRYETRGSAIAVAIRSTAGIGQYCPTNFTHQSSSSPCRKLGNVKLRKGDCPQFVVGAMPSVTPAIPLTTTPAA